MIPHNILQQIQQDFLHGPDHEKLLIPNEDFDEFWDWFSEMAVEYGVVNDNPIPEFINASFYAGRCFGNSQTISLTHNLLYCEGFVRVHGRYIFHGFNVVQDTVLDVTVLNNPQIFVDLFGISANGYVGMPIPREMIVNSNLDAIFQGAVNIPHLLYELFNQENH